MYSSEKSAKDIIGSELFQTQNPSQSTQHQSSGLARYRSAPSSFLAAHLDSETNNNSSSGDESEAIFSAFMNGTRDLNQKGCYDGAMQFGMKQEIGVGSGTGPGEGNGFVNGQMGYEGAVNVGGGSVVGSYSVGMESAGGGQVHVRGRNGNGSNLLRQTSSPAGFLNGYSVMGEVGNYKIQNQLEATSSVNGLSNLVNFSSGPSSSLRFMPSIPECANESIIGPETGNIRNGIKGNAREFEASAFTHDSWNEYLKRNGEGDLKMFSTFSGLENQGQTGKSWSSGLVHHMSMPKTSSEMAAVEKYLQFQPDTTTVPCQVRAKRGFATHPRSIAERVRRTKISDKMKKLQDLFPSIDKQTSTSDMLDLAVEYIKDLQKQVETMSDTRAKCVCATKPQQ